jgi:hypothetical protein
MKKAAIHAGIFAAALALGVPSTRAQPVVVDGVFCDTLGQMQSVAEAHLGAQLSIKEALRVINEAADRVDACVPMSRLIVEDVVDVKELVYGEDRLMVRRVSVIGVILDGSIARGVVPKEQYVLVKLASNAQEI